MKISSLRSSKHSFSAPNCILRIVLVFAAVCFFAAPAARASIVSSGDVEPYPPSTWTPAVFSPSTFQISGGTTGIIGNTANGALTINNGSTLASAFGYLGNQTGVTGTVSINGAGSSWNLNSNSGSQFNLIVGRNGGVGILSVTNGANITTGGMTATPALGNGSVTISGVGSTWTNQNNTVNIDNCSLNILNGGVVTGNSSYTLAGSSADTRSSITVSGAGSTIGGGFLVAYHGSASLTVLNGGTVNANGGVNVGYYNGSSGKVVVDGAGSTLISSNPYGALSVGSASFSNGVGTLSVSDGAAVNATGLVVGNSSSVFTIDVGTGSSLAVGSGSRGGVTNNGTIRYVAGAGAATGTYSPISGPWNNAGNLQALGGVVNPDYSVTVNAAAATTAGVQAFIDLSQTQRVLVTDPTTGKSVGAGFQAATSYTPLGFTATTITGSLLNSLDADLSTGQSVLSAWKFSTGGYTSGSPVYLSLFAGAGQNLSGLTIWDYANGTWSQFSATDLAYNNTYASFTTTNLNDYAVTGTTPTPVPSALLLLGPGLAGLGFMRRKIFKA